MTRPNLQGCRGNCHQGRKACDCGHEHQPTAAMPLCEFTKPAAPIRRADLFLVAVALATGAAALGMVLGSTGVAP